MQGLKGEASSSSAGAVRFICEAFLTATLSKRCVCRKDKNVTEVIHKAEVKSR
jgi:hypothetical protein